MFKIISTKEFRRLVEKVAELEKLEATREQQVTQLVKDNKSLRAQLNAKIRENNALKEEIHPF